MTTNAQLLKKIEDLESRLKGHNDDDLQALWHQKAKSGKKYWGGKVEAPDGRTFWICLFENQYFKKGSNLPKYRIALNDFVEKG